MKFTKEQAIESLKSELTNKGKKTLRMSERTLNSIVDALLPKFADEDTGLPDFITEAMTILGAVNDNVGNDRSVFIKQWEKEHSKSNDEPATPTPGNEPAPKENEELIAIRKELEQMKAEREQERKNHAVSAKRNELMSALQEKGVKDKEWITDFLSEVNITEDMDVTQKTESILKLYNKSIGQIPPAPTPLQPTPGLEKDENDSLAIASKLAKQKYESEQELMK